MKQEINDFLTGQNIGVITVLMPDGAPHSASIHFAHNENFQFFFATTQSTLKAAALNSAEPVKSALVVGFDQVTMRTIQAHGIARLMHPEESQLFKQVYTGKFPHVPINNMDPKNVYFTFIAEWWRYSDFKHPEGKLIITSEDTNP